MNHTFTTKLNRCLLALMLAIGLSFTSVKASHSMAADITYTCIGNGQYLMQLQFFRDCGGITPAGTYSLTYASAICGVDASIQLSQQGLPVDVTPVCASASSNCGGGGGSFGIEQWTYSGIVTLPAGCGTDWIFEWSTCCRNGAITTLSGASSQNFYVFSTLDNTVAPCNNSPVFVNDPTPVVCINTPVSYSHGVSDPDGDSLVFSLTNCLVGPGASVGYAGGFSGVSPVSTSGGITIDPNTGTISFIPNATQVGVICVLVEEFRNGVKISEIVRDMQFRVLSCSNDAPVASSINSTLTYITTACAGSNICFNILGSDVNSDNVTMTWNQGIPNGQITFSNQGSSTPSAVFCWTPTTNDIGSNFFTLTVTDDACPLTGVNTYSYEIIVQGTPNTLNAGSDQSICEGSSASLNAISTGASSYSWTPTTGLSCTTCPNPTATPAVATAYTVTAVFPDGCTLSDVVNVGIAPDPIVNLTPPVSYSCPGASILMTAISPTATGYSWSTGGSGVNESVSVGVTTNVSVTVTDALGCTASDTATVNIASPSGSACNVIYASPGASGVGSSFDPADLVVAIGMASCNNTVIKMDIGTYNIANPITNLTSFLTLEGGFDQGNGWRKTSAAGATTINRTAANVQNATGLSPRLIAFQINGQTEFRLQDLTITTVNAPVNGPGQRGISTYAVHMTNCSNYNFTRCQLLAGNAGQGDNGSAGANGSIGSGGINGQNGDSDNQNDARAGGRGGNGGGAGSGNGGNGAPAAGGCCSTGTNGTAGVASSNFRAGGGGGGGARGGQEDRDGGTGGNGGARFGGTSTTCGGGAGQESNCNSVRSSCQSGLSGGDGCNGGAGPNGTNGGLGSAGAFAGGFYNPGGVGGNGTDARGGSGGKGGGGGCGEGGTFCSDGAGASGGGGGGGGQGGGLGTGAFGGGASIGLYLFANGANGRVVDCLVNAGSAGAGGAGGNGGTAGNGGNGGNGGGDDINDFEIGCGGDGGNGGNGGVGGSGGNGRAGTAANVRLDGGSGLAQNISTFSLSAQPVILMENISCTASSMDYSSFGSATWNLGTGSSPTTPTGSTVTTTYSSTGRKDIDRASNTYTGFSNIILGTGIVPDAGTNAPLVAGEFRICAGDAINFDALNPGLNYLYAWNMGGGSAPNTYTGTNFDVVTNVTFNTPGDYFITLQYTTDCCGQSSIDSIHIFVDDQPNVAAAGGQFCAGDGIGINLNASGASSYTWTPATGLNNTVGSSVQAYPNATTTYTISGVNSIGNCADQSTVTVTVNDIDLVDASAVASCGANGLVSVTATGGSGSYTYDWTPLLTQTTSSVPNLPAGNYPVVVSDQITGCQDSMVAVVPAGSNLLQPFISGVTSVSCFNGINGSASIAHTGGTGPAFVYTWADTTAPSVPVGGNGSTTTPLPAGTYLVTIFDIGNPGCPAAALVTIPEPIVVDVTQIDSITPSCSLSNGSIMVNASGGTGPYTYSWLTTPVQTGDTAFGLPVGSYQVVATDINGCDDTTTVTLDCLLPVEWLYFAAAADRDAIQLDWATGSEENNQGFEVWRASEGAALDFENIGWVDANPSGEAGSEYDFRDNGVIPGITYYYRLAQVDFDGQQSYSEIRQAMLPGMEGLAINSYPSPIVDIVNLEIDLMEAAELEVVIINGLGQSVGIQKSFSVEEGRNTLEMNLRGLASGIYFAKVSRNGSAIGSVKLLKVD